MNCPSCAAADLPASARFCPACGAPLAAPPPNPPSAPAETRIDVDQQVGSLEGGQVTGVGIEHLTGDVTVHEAPGVVHGDLVAGDKTVAGDAVGGDKITASIGSVGAGAQVAVGREISQMGGAGPAGLDETDREALRLGLAACAAQLDGLGLPPAKVPVAREFLAKLARALAEGAGPPDGAKLKVTGDWLVENVPELRAPLGELFAGPAGRRALAAAGEAAERWAAGRFG